MIRSLVVKVYLAAAIVLALMGAGALASARFLIDTGHVEAMRLFGRTQALLIAGELERTADVHGPTRKRMLQLGALLHSRLRYVNWAATQAYPPMLASDKVFFEPGPLPGPSWRRYWVRLDDHQGHPLGALEIQYGPGVDRLAHIPFVIMGGSMAGLALLVIPPLWWWVLRPLKRMVGVAHRLGAGDLATPVPVTRDDELGELEAAFEALRHRVANMLFQKEKLLGDMSHELRGPLARMAIALPLLDAPPEAPAAIALQREIDAMDRLIGELLALARAQTPEALAREPVDLAAIAGEQLAARELARERAGLAATAALAPAPATGDARQLARAIGNVLDNALKYTPAGGTLRVETGVADGQVFCRVTDDGPGVDPADLAQLFEPFYRPDTSRSRETGGVGLGLAIVRAIAEAHGGTVTLAPVPPHGTRAELRLPPRG